MKTAKDTHYSGPPPNEAHSPTTADTHPRKAGDKPGDSLPAAGVPASTCHWGTNDHPQAEHRPYHQSGSQGDGQGKRRCQR